MFQAWDTKINAFEGPCNIKAKEILFWSPPPQLVYTKQVKITYNQKSI